MNTWHDLGLLWAAKPDLWRELGSGFQGERSHFQWQHLMTLLGVLSLVVLVFWGLSRILAKENRRAGYNNPRALFRALCHAHNLSRHDSRLLSRLARSHTLEPAARIFLEPNLFAIERLDSRLQGYASEISALQQQLFSTTDGKEDAESSATPKVAV